MSTEEDVQQLEARIALLRAFLADLDDWTDGQPSNADAWRELRRRINHALPAVRRAVERAGTGRWMTIAPSPMVGGLVHHKVNPFDSIFDDLYGESLMDTARDCVEESIGFYTAMISDPDLMTVRSREAIDLEAALERAVRPSFRSAPPAREKDVQDAVENVLNATGFQYTRERDSVTVGARAFIPDFVLSSLDLALEVKLTKPGHGASEVQEELAADLTAYRTRWRRILFVVYDIGEIQNPYAFRMNNMRQLAAPVIIVKH